MARGTRYALSSLNFPVVLSLCTCNITTNSSSEASMIWPPTLVGTVMMYTLHDNSKTDPSTADGWSISRFRFFLIVFIGSFTWYWFPGFIAQFLSVFAIVTWIKPKNVILNQLFGGWSGISLLPITFDWTQITGRRVPSLVEHHKLIFSFQDTFLAL